MVHNVFSNKIEITCGIHEGLYFFLYKNHHESSSVCRTFVLFLTMTSIRLIHFSNLYSSCIGPGFFALLCIAEFLPTLRFFVVFSFTIRAKDLFLTSIFMWRAGNKSTTLLKLSRNRSYKRNTCWQEWFWLTIQVALELFCEGNYNFYLGRVVDLIPNLCFKGIESSVKRIVWLIGRFFGLHPIKPWSMESMGAIS